MAPRRVPGLLVEVRAGWHVSPTANQHDAIAAVELALAEAQRLAGRPLAVLPLRRDAVAGVPWSPKSEGVIVVRNTRRPDAWARSVNRTSPAAIWTRTLGRSRGRAMSVRYDPTFAVSDGHYRQRTPAGQRRSTLPVGFPS